jgi:hypothetical protein
MFAEFKVVSGATGKVLGYAHTKAGAENLADHCVINDGEVVVKIMPCLDNEAELSYTFITN